tara:strand:- start:291 stop:539 length:249 start_codon:yes stop_codon:yes gene_type:complete
MGKHIKTSMDQKVIDYLAIELYIADPENIVLKKFMEMKNEEGYSLTKTINEFKKTGKHPDHYNTDGTWSHPGGKITFEEFKL